MQSLKLRNGKSVGHVKDGVAVIPVKPRNYYGAYGGYSIDAEVLTQIQRAGCHTIEFHYKSSKAEKQFRIDFNTFLAHRRATPDYGYGTKYVVHESHYTLVGPQVPSTT